MYCRKCGKQIPDDSEFCKYCGADLREPKEHDSFQNESVQNSASYNQEHIEATRTENDRYKTIENKEKDQVNNKNANDFSNANNTGTIIQQAQKKNIIKPLIIIAICAVLVLVIVLVAKSNKKSNDTVNNSSSEVTKEAVKSTPTPTATTSSQAVESDMQVKQLSDYQSINDEIDAEVLTMTNKVESSSDSLVASINENYDNFKANRQAITDFYSTTLADQVQLYNNINEYCKMSYRLMISSGDTADYKKWDDAMSDLYKTWDDGMSDYYKAWDRSMDDVYKAWDRACDNAPDNTDYTEKSNLWSDTYDEHQKAWSDMYDQHQDAWSDLYDQQQDVWSDFYDHDTNIDDDLNDSVAGS